MAKKKKKKVYIRRKVGNKKLTPAMYIKAIADTGGILGDIAKKLDTTRTTVKFALEQRDGEGWDIVREIYQDECMRMTDMSEKVVQRILKQKKDLAMAQKSAHWYLEKTNPRYKTQKNIKLEGGETPLRLEQEQKQVVKIDDLNLPLSVRKLLLEQLERVDDEETDEEAA